ncbi:MAG: hypothetical protein JSU92_00815 [Deltaproteobacteria bacterium]|nr:MAG: hypothetical protein JSU92_00815 [Deltaproteobacteria bacterium]
MKRKALKVVLLSSVLALTFGLMPGCGDDGSSNGTKECEEKNTMHLTFQNRKAELADIVLDGVAIARALPTCGEVERDIEAGIKHTVDFINSSTGSRLCSEAEPIYPVCTYYIIWCGEATCD